MNQPVQEASRQAAYLARNRAALIKAGQEVLATLGPAATIEQLAAHAEVSTTTIYKYFENKEALFSEALAEIWNEWVAWSYGETGPQATLQSTIGSARKLFHLNKTHPQLAKILQKVMVNPSFVINAVKHDGEQVFKELADRGQIEKSNFNNRLILWAYCLAGLLTAVYVTEELDAEDAEAALGLGLSIWGLSETQAQKLVSTPLVISNG